MSDSDRITEEPVRVEWTGGLENEWVVEVDPYAGTVSANGTEYDVTELADGEGPL